MKIGTKSLLYGSHQFIWHPIQVTMAWITLFKQRPNWREMICIIIHDWGYWGCPNLDGEEGEKHPEWAAKWAAKNLDVPRHKKLWHTPRGYEHLHEYHDLCLYHSRHYAKNHNAEPSKLCWVDKYCIKYDPWWFYLARVCLSGEIKELRWNNRDYCSLSCTNREWFVYVQALMIKVALAQKGDAAPYVNSSK